MKLVGLHFSTDIDDETTLIYLLAKELCICLNREYPELIENIKLENYKDLRLFCKLQGYKLIPKIFIK